MKQGSEVQSNSSPQPITKSRTNPFSVSMTQGIKCTSCHNDFSHANCLNCAGLKCKVSYCIPCLKPLVHPELTTEAFNEMRLACKWLCPSCRILQEEDGLLMQKDFNRFLMRKRQRIVYKMKSAKSEGNASFEEESNPNSINKAIIIIINRYIQKLNKIQDTDVLDPKHMLTQSEGEKVEDKEQSISNRKESSNEKKAQGSKPIGAYFPNYDCNTQLNELIVQAAVKSKLCKRHKSRKKGNKPCIICEQDNCPCGIEMVRFKHYKDFLSFLNGFFLGIEFHLSSELAVDREVFFSISTQKEQLSKLQESGFSKENSIKVVKIFCSNCIANAFRQENGVYRLFNSCKDSDDKVESGHDEKVEKEYSLTTQMLLDKDIDDTIAVEKKESLKPLFSCSSINEEPNLKLSLTLNPSKTNQKVINKDTSLNTSENLNTAHPNTNINNNTFNINLTAHSISSFDINAMKNESNAKKKVAPLSQPKKFSIKILKDQADPMKKSQFVQETEHSFCINSTVQKPSTEAIPNVMINPFYPYQFPQSFRLIAIPQSQMPVELPLKLLHYFYTCLYSKYVYPLENIHLDEVKLLASISNLANAALTETEEKSDSQLAEQIQAEIARLDQKAKERADLFSFFAIELRELERYFKQI